MSAKRFGRLVVLIFVLLLSDALAGDRVIGSLSIHAAQTIDHADASRTFIRPRLQIGAGDSAQHHRITRGVPGVCELLGMDGFLQKYVVRSADIADGVELNNHGVVVANRPGYYIESVTCTATQPYWPALIAESVEQHEDGSVTVLMPSIHTGPQVFQVVSGHIVGVCRLLGYNTMVKRHLAWSEERVSGVSMSMDGKIYLEATGTYVTSVTCKNVSPDNASSAARDRFDEQIREYRDQQTDFPLYDD